MAMDGQQRGDFLPGRRLPALEEGDHREAHLAPRFGFRVQPLFQRGQAFVNRRNLVLPAPCLRSLTPGR